MCPLWRLRQQTGLLHLILIHAYLDQYSVRENAVSPPGADQAISDRNCGSRRVIIMPAQSLRCAGAGELCQTTVQKRLYGVAILGGSEAPALDRIFIRDLMVRGIVGINPDERRNRQDIVVNATFYVDTRPAGASDDVADAVNYRSVAKALIAHIEASQPFLVEHLAADLVALCFEQDARVAGGGAVGREAGRTPVCPFGGCDDLPAPTGYEGLGDAARPRRGREQHRPLRTTCRWPWTGCAGTRTSGSSRSARSTSRRPWARRCRSHPTRTPRC